MRNIIWIIVDSVRNYTCPAERVDDRGRIELMNELADRWIDFRTVVTSAPSTVMSISAMLTSCPAYYLGANFMGMRLRDCGQPNIATILAPFGYRTYAITLGPYERESWDDVLDIVPRRLWPRNARHRHEWDNVTINETLVRLVREGMKEPFFFLLHYNCRNDEHISKNVALGLNCLESSGLLDNSVVLLTSDHGYPDPLRKEEVTRRRKLAALEHRSSAHDLVLTDDNVLVPLLIRYPGHTPRRVEQQICTLDYLPTSLELAGIADYPPLQGRSVARLMQGMPMPELDDRFIRIDGRFLAQTGRCTAIRSPSRKYIVYPDAAPDDREQFFDLATDVLETENLLVSGSTGYEEDIARFRKWFDDDTDRARHFQKRFMKETFLREWNSTFGARPDNRPQSVLFVRSDRIGFDELLNQILREIFGQGTVDSIARGELNGTEVGPYDLALAVVPSHREGRAACRALRHVAAGTKALVSLNLNVMRFSRCYAMTALAKDWRLNGKYYLNEPLYWLSKATKGRWPVKTRPAPSKRKAED